MQEEMSKKSGGLTMLFLFALSVFLLIKFTFAGVTLLIALVALGMSFNTQNVITGNRLKLVAGVFGLFCVLNIYTELTRGPATADHGPDYYKAREKTPEEIEKAKRRDSALTACNGFNRTYEDTKACMKGMGY